MLKKNNYECKILSKTIKFGSYDKFNDDYPWYIKDDLEIKESSDYPLTITVKFMDEDGECYLQFWMEHIDKDDLNHLANKAYDGTFSLNNNTFTLFEMYYKGFILDSNDTKTDIKIIFGDVDNDKLRANIKIKSEDFDIIFDDFLSKI